MEIKINDEKKKQITILLSTEIQRFLDKNKQALLFTVKNPQVVCGLCGSHDPLANDTPPLPLISVLVKSRRMCIRKISLCRIVSRKEPSGKNERASERARTRACTKRLRAELKRVRVSDGSSGVLSCSEIRRLNLNGAATRRLSPCVV